MASTSEGCCELIEVFRGTWVPQLVKLLSLAQVMIPGSWDQALYQTPCSAEPAFLPPSAAPPCLFFLCQKK